MTLVGAIGKLWSDNRRLERELAAAHAHNAELQAEAFREHRRDLRVLVGLPVSQAPAPLDPLRPPLLILRPEPPKKQRPPRKKRD